MNPLHKPNRLNYLFAHPVCLPVWIIAVVLTVSTYWNSYGWVGNALLGWLVLMWCGAWLLATSNILTYLGGHLEEKGGKHETNMARISYR